MKYAIVDMGSNSIRLTVYYIEGNNFKILFKQKVMAGLAGYVENGQLSQEGINCACHTLKDFQSTLSLLEIKNLSVFATASLRNISNSLEAVKQIYSETGIEINVLSGETEAECGFFGAVSSLNTSEGLFVDIGGASTEIAYFNDYKIKNAISKPVGSLKLYRDYVKKILPGDCSRQRIENEIETVFNKVPSKDVQKVSNILSVGGTVRACLHLCKKVFDLAEESSSFTSKQLYALVELFKNETTATELILRHAPERIHTLIPGMMILEYLTSIYDVETITVSNYGVREGYLKKYISPTLETLI